MAGEARDIEFELVGNRLVDKKNTVEIRMRSVLS